MKECVSCKREVKILNSKQDERLCYDCWYLEVEKAWSGC